MRIKIAWWLSLGALMMGVGFQSTGASALTIANDESRLIPELRPEISDIPKLSWSTVLLPEDILYRTGFEVGDDVNSTATTNASHITSSEQYSGEKSLYVKNSRVYGNNGHSDGTVSYRYDLNRVYGLTPGMKFTANVKMKAVESTPISVNMGARGATSVRYSYPFHEKYGFGEPIIVAEDTSNTPGEVRIQNYEYLKSKLKDNFAYYVAQKQVTDYGSYTTFKKTQLNKKANRIPLL